MQTPRFASLENDDDYDSDDKALMPVQDDNDFTFKPSIQTVNR